MNVLASQIDHLPIVSLQTGETIAYLHRPIITISALTVPAFYCKQDRGQQALILSRDIRQFADEGILVNSDDDLSAPDDIARLSGLLASSYQPLGKPVVSDLGRKLGMVRDYVLNTDTGRIQKLHVCRSWLHAFLGDIVIIDRAQITDVTPRQITVRDSVVKLPLLHTKPIPEVPS